MNLKEFTNLIKINYEQGNILSPVHLSGGNERQLIRIFKDVSEKDWIFSTWRSHYHWLLSGRDRRDLYKQILDGHSMHIYDERFFTSAIVAGISPIAVGVAMGIKLNKGTDHVWCFLGDAAWECGITKESIRYSQGHDLPITFVLEDNDMCVRAKTKEIWGLCANGKTLKYKYLRKYPHAGTGTYIMF